MKSFLTFLFCLTLIQLKAQTDSTRIISYYRNTKYQLDTLSLNDAKLKLIIARLTPRGSFADNPIWLHFNKAGLTDTYINSITSETGVYVPKEQPLIDLFLIVSCGEGHGKIILIDNDNNLTMIPGYQFAIDKSKNVFYTRSIGDGDHIVSQFNPETRELVTKPWNNRNGEPWGNNLGYYKVEPNDWIK